MLSQEPPDAVEAWAVQLSVVPSEPEFDTERVWEPGFDPPMITLKDILCLSRPIAGAVRLRLTGIVRVLEAPAPEIVIVSLYVPWERPEISTETVI